MKTKLLSLIFLCSYFSAQYTNKQTYLFHPNPKTTYLEKNNYEQTDQKSSIEIKTDLTLDGAIFRYNLYVIGEYRKAYQLTDNQIAGDGAYAYTHKGKKYYFYDTPFMPIKPTVNGNHEVNLYNVLFYPAQHTGENYEHIGLNPAKPDPTYKYLALNPVVYQAVDKKMKDLVSRVTQLQTEIKEIGYENFQDCIWITGEHNLQTIRIGKHSCVERSGDSDLPNMEGETDAYKNAYAYANSKIGQAGAAASLNCNIDGQDCHPNNIFCGSACEEYVQSREEEFRKQLKAIYDASMANSRKYRTEQLEKEVLSLKSDNHYTVRLSDFNNPEETMALGFNAADQTQYKVKITISDDFGVNDDKTNVNLELGQILFIPEFEHVNLLDYLRIPTTEDCPVGKCLQVNLKNSQGQSLQFVKDTYEFIPYSHGISEFKGTITQRFDNGDHQVAVSVNIDALKFTENDGLLKYCQNDGRIDLRKKLNYYSEKTVFDSKDFAIEDKFFINLNVPQPNSSGVIRAIHDGGLQNAMAILDITENEPIKDQPYSLCGAELPLKNSQNNAYTYNLNDLLEDKTYQTVFMKDGQEIKNGILQTNQNGNIAVQVLRSKGNCSNRSDITVQLNQSPVSPKILKDIHNFDLCAGELPTVEFSEKKENNFRLYAQKVTDYTNATEVNNFGAELPQNAAQTTLQYPEFKRTLFAYQYNTNTKCLSKPVELAFVQHAGPDIPSHFFDNPFICGEDLSNRNKTQYRYDLSDFLKNIKAGMIVKDKNGNIIKDNLLTTADQGPTTFEVRTTYGTCAKTRDVVLNLQPSPAKPQTFDNLDSFTLCKEESPTIEFTNWPNSQQNVRVYDRQIFYLDDTQTQHNFKELLGTEKERTLTYPTQNDRLYAYLFDTQSSCFSKPLTLKFRDENEPNLPNFIWDNPLICGDAQGSKTIIAKNSKNGQYTYDLNDFLKAYQTQNNQTTFELDGKIIKNGILTTDKSGTIDIRVRNTYGRCKTNRNVTFNLQHKPAKPTLLDPKNECFICDKENPHLEFTNWNGAHNLRVYDKKLSYLDKEQVAQVLPNTELTIHNLPNTNITYNHPVSNKELFAYQYNPTNLCLSQPVAVKISQYKVPLDFTVSHNVVNPGDKPTITLPKSFYENYKNVNFEYAIIGRDGDGNIIEDQKIHDNFFQYTFNRPGLYDITLNLNYEKPNGAKCFLTEEKRDMVKVLAPTERPKPEPVIVEAQLKNGNIHIFLDKELVDVYVVLMPDNKRTILKYEGYHSFLKDWDYKVASQVPYFLTIYQGKKPDPNRIVYQLKLYDEGNYTAEYKAQHNINPDFKN